MLTARTGSSANWSPVSNCCSSLLWTRLYFVTQIQRWMMGMNDRRFMPYLAYSAQLHFLFISPSASLAYTECGLIACESAAPCHRPVGDIIPEKLFIVGCAQFSMMACARSFGLLPRRSATPCSVIMIFTECSLWSRWETIVTIALILPSLATDGRVKIEI